MDSFDKEGNEVLSEDEDDYDEEFDDDEEDEEIDEETYKRLKEEAAARGETLEEFDDEEEYDDEEEGEDEYDDEESDDDENEDDQVGSKRGPSDNGNDGGLSKRKKWVGKEDNN